MKILCARSGIEEQRGKPGPSISIRRQGLEPHHDFIAAEKGWGPWRIVVSEERFPVDGQSSRARPFHKRVSGIATPHLPPTGVNPIDSEFPSRLLGEADIGAFRLRRPGIGHRPRHDEAHGAGTIRHEYRRRHRDLLRSFVLPKKVSAQPSKTHAAVVIIRRHGSRDQCETGILPDFKKALRFDYRIGR